MTLIIYYIILLCSYNILLNWYGLVYRYPMMIQKNTKIIKNTLLICGGILISSVYCVLVLCQCISCMCSTFLYLRGWDSPAGLGSKITAVHPVARHQGYVSRFSGARIAAGATNTQPVRLHAEEPLQTRSRHHQTSKVYRCLSFVYDATLLFNIPKP